MLLSSVVLIASAALLNYAMTLMDASLSSRHLAVLCRISDRKSVV